MAKVFFPSCKVLATYPEASKKLQGYLAQNQAIDSVAGCCRTDRTQLSPDDTAVLICNTCMSFCEESSDADELLSVWEIIDNDPAFTFPDYKGEQMVVQDCWRAVGRHEVHDAIRSLLKKMNIDAIEIEGNRDGSLFCGVMTYMPIADYYEEYAPRKFGEEAKAAGLFQEHTQEEQKELLGKHLSQFPVGKAVSYCVGCDAAGLSLGGVDSYSMINLVFDEA